MLEPTNRDTSNTSTIPTCPSAICSVSCCANPDRATEPEPMTPRSGSITRIAVRGQRLRPAGQVAGLSGAPGMNQAEQIRR